MNYRHLYHAGNHTEVFKHSVLTVLLQASRIFLIDTLSAGIGHPLVARKSDQLIRLSTGAPLTPPSPAVRNHRNAVRLALESVSALHRIPHQILVSLRLPPVFQH